MKGGVSTPPFDRAFISWTSSCRVASCHAGLQEHGQTCQGTRGEGPLGTFTWWKARKEALRKSSPSTPNALLHWPCAKRPDENHAQHHPETFRQQLGDFETFSELFLTCTSFILRQLKDDLKVGLTGSLTPTTTQPLDRKFFPLNARVQITFSSIVQSDKLSNCCDRI